MKLALMCTYTVTVAVRMVMLVGPDCRLFMKDGCSHNDVTQWFMKSDFEAWSLPFFASKLGLQGAPRVSMSALYIQR